MQEKGSTKRAESEQDTAEVRHQRNHYDRLLLCNNQIVTTLICIEGWDFHAVNTCLVFSFTSYNFTAAFVVWPVDQSDVRQDHVRDQPRVHE